MRRDSLTVVIVNWNGMLFLPDCLESLAANPPSIPYDVIAVDNRSTDGSREWLASDGPPEVLHNGQFKHILNDENLGFGRANNIAFRNSNSEFILILNPDTRVSSGAIDRLLRSLTSEETIVAVAPKILNPDGTIQGNIGFFPSNPLIIILNEFGLAKWLPKKLSRRIYGYAWKYDEERAVPAVWGTAVLAKRQAIEAAGPFDEDFFMYGEDIEWCARVNRKGLKTVFVPDASVVHLGGKSSEQAWPSWETVMRKYAAVIMVERKSLPRAFAGCNALTRLGIHLLVFAKRKVSGRHEGLRKHKIKMELLALRELFVGQHREKLQNGGKRY